MKWKLRKNNLFFQRQGLDTFQLLATHRKSAEDRDVKLIEVAEWRPPRYISKKGPDGSIMLEVFLNCRSSFDGISI